MIEDVEGVEDGEDAFFVPDGDGFVATEHARGPWSERHQHAGPPAALLARAFEALAGDMWIARLSYELVRPIPIGRLTVRTSELRPGRRVRQWGATLLDGDTEVVRASAVGIRQTTLEFEQPSTLPPEPAIPPPEACEETMFPFFASDVGYHTSMELRIGRGGVGHGHAVAWLRMRHPLVLGEEPSALQRLAIAADSGNGVSAALDHERFVFINPDLTVYVHRLPEGEHIGLSARTIAERRGVGLADDRMYDRRGPVARACQSLMLAPR